MSPAALLGVFLAASAAFAQQPAAPIDPKAEQALKESGVQMALGDLEAARLLATDAIALDTASPRGYLQRASVELQLKAFDQAVKDADKAVALGFRKASVFNVRSESYSGEGLYARALADAEIAVAANPASGAGYANRAAAKRGLSGLDEAVAADLRRAAELDARYRPRYEDARAELAKSRPGDASARTAPASARPPAGPRAPLLGPKKVLAAAAAACLLVLLVSDWRRRRSRRVRFASVISLPSESDAPRSGSVLGGRFIVGRRVGPEVGGEVYEGRDLEDRPRHLRRYALPRELAKRSLAIERARAAAKVKHPSVETIDGIIESGDSLILACVPAPGEPLHALAARYPQRRMPSEHALRALAGVCAGLEAAHALGLAHGGVSAGCVYVDRLSSVIVELGAPRLEASPEGDLFALAACLYELLAGEPPFPGPDAEQQKREGRFAPPSKAVPGVAAGLDGFFARALNPDPAQRFRAANEIFISFKSVVVPLVQ